MEAQAKKTTKIQVRLSEKELREWKMAARRDGYEGLSSFIRRVMNERARKKK